MSAIPERVAAGVALLDEKHPGWWKEDARRGIALAVLDLDDCERCILGQLFNEGEDHENYCGYEAGTQILGIPAKVAAADDYGFDGSFDEIPGLAAEWKRAIAGRRALVTA